MRSITSVSIFDQNIVRTSPAGSCVLRIVEELACDIPLHLFSNRADVPESKLVCTTKIPLPPGPVVLRSVFFTLFSCFAHWLSGRRRFRCRRRVRSLSAIFAMRTSAIAFFFASIGMPSAAERCADSAHSESHLGVIYRADCIPLRENDRSAVPRIGPRTYDGLSRNW
jgi:hypothetical protein